jgi:putative hemolysin
MEILIFIAILAIFTAMSAFFSASETAFFSLSAITLKTYKHHSDARKALIWKILSRPQELLVTILIMNICVNILIQNVASHIFGATSGWTFRVGVPLILTLIFGEIIPKTIAIQNNAKIAYHVTPPIILLKKGLGPLRSAITLITRYVYRTLFFFLKKEEDISRHELMHVLKASEEFGVLHSHEAKFVNGYLHLQELTVKELMKPREDTTLFETKNDLAHLIHLFVEDEFSRLPVSEDGIDNIKGILSAHTFFMHLHDIHSPSDIFNFLEKPFFVPETTPAKLLLRQLRQNKKDMALVVDEYGAITGLITEEDLVEVVVGPILDKHEEKPLYTTAGHDVIIASGKLELTLFTEIFAIELESENNMVTVGGWLTEVLGDIPKSGTKYIGHGFLFHVLAADPNRVRRIYIRRLSSNLHAPGSTSEEEVIS